MISKICNKCGIKKDLEGYSKDKSKKDGYRGICKECTSEKNKKYWKENKEIIGPKNKLYRDNNKDVLKENRREYSKQYREQNKDILSEKNREYYKRKKLEQSPKYIVKPGYKICTKCTIEKCIAEFSFKNKSKNQRQSYCKSCQSNSQKLSYNPEKTRQHNKKYWKENKEALTAQNKIYYVNNKGSINNQKKEYNKKNSESLKLSRKEYYQNNKQHLEIKKKEYANNNVEKLRIARRNLKIEKRKTDIQFKLRENISGRIRSAIKNSKGIKKTKMADLIGCSVFELRLHLESKFLPTMSWSNYGKEWHIDHILPCSLFDLTDVEQQKECFHYTNLQPLWATTRTIDDIEYIGNINKGANILDVFQRNTAA